MTLKFSLQKKTNGKLIVVFFKLRFKLKTLNYWNDNEFSTTKLIENFHDFDICVSYKIEL